MTAQTDIATTAVAAARPERDVPEIASQHRDARHRFGRFALDGFVLIG